MKRALNYAAFMLLLAVMVSGGCAKDDTSLPDDDKRSKFLGKWKVNENWTKLNYEVNITADPSSSDGVFISNFGNIGSTYPPAGAAISGSDILLDPDQVIGDGITVNGSGKMSGSVISWSYTLNDQATLIYATAVYTRP